MEMSDAFLEAAWDEGQAGGLPGGGCKGKLEQEARVLVSSGQTEVLEQLKGEALTWDFLCIRGPSAPPSSSQCRWI